MHVVGIVEKASLGDVEVPDGLDLGIEAHHGEGERPVVVLDRRFLLRHTHHVAAERNVVAEEFNVVVGEAHLHACLAAPGLLRGAAGKDAHGGGAKALEDGLDGFAEAVPIGQKKNDGGDAPGHARHGEQGAAQVMAHGAVGLLEQVAVHGDDGRSEP